MLNAGTFTRRFRQWLAEQIAARRARARLRQELNALGPDQTERLLHDVGLTPAELPALIRRHPETRNVLERMMDAVGIDWRRLLRSEPETLRDLAVACNGCRAFSRCRRELGRGTAGRSFRAFCPNAPRLELIRAVRPTVASGPMTEFGIKPNL